MFFDVADYIIVFFLQLFQDCKVLKGILETAKYKNTARQGGNRAIPPRKFQKHV